MKDKFVYKYVIFEWKFFKNREYYKIYELNFD